MVKLQMAVGMINQRTSKELKAFFMIPKSLHGPRPDIIARGASARSHEASPWNDDHTKTPSGS